MFMCIVYIIISCFCDMKPYAMECPQYTIYIEEGKKLPASLLAVETNARMQPNRERILAEVFIWMGNRFSLR